MAGVARLCGLMGRGVLVSLCSGRWRSFVFPPPIVLPGVGGFAGVGVCESRRGLASSHETYGGSL